MKYVIYSRQTVLCFEPCLANVVKLALNEGPHQVINRLLHVQEVHIHAARLSNSVGSVLCLEAQCVNFASFGK